ncbi:MAG: hypothetical protein J6386_01750 [Candidatus Synoicihabitans palmerolidicus]|nr:hypothetical protein [Candidatus Synoicihabitans palmerolidicus]
MKLRVFGWAVLVVLSLVRPVEAAEPTRDEVASLIARQARSWETGDEAEFLDTLRSDVVFAYPGKRLDLACVLQIFRDWKRDFKDTRMTMFRTVIDGRHFEIEYVFASTRIASDGRTATGTVAIGEFKDGKLFVWKEYLDGRVSRMQAKGELPVDEQAEPYPWPDTQESRWPECGGS